MNNYLDAPQAIYKLTDKNGHRLEVNEKFAKIYSKAIIII